MPSKKTKTAKKPPVSRFAAAPHKQAIGWARDKISLNRSLSPHRSFRVTHKHDKPRPNKLPSSWQLVKQTYGLFKMSPKVFTGLILVYLIAVLVVIGSGTQQDYLGLKDAVVEVFGSNGFDKVGSLFGALLSGALTPTMTELQQYLQFVFIFLGFLAFIWTARQVMSGNRPTIAQALYNSPTPLISGSLLLALMTLQLLPAAVGIFVFAVANNKAFFDYAGLALLLGFLMVLLITFSLYLVVTTVIGMVVVTLPGMYPLAAMSSTKRLIIGRRVPVLMKLVGLALWIFALWAVVIVPFLLLDSFTNIEAVPFIPAAMVILSGVSVAFGSLYLYRLYRSLLDE